MKQNDPHVLEETLSGGETSNESAPMNPHERRATVALAAIYALRMLGLFLILPVITLYASEYAGYSVALAGLAIGIYGLTQAVFQIPFGLLSDRIGRKPVIAAGLTLFALGSIVAALADSMSGIIAGRALQGAGAVAAATMALAADLTREEQRTKAMAVIGASIGLSFAVALVLGPALAAGLGLRGVFWVTCALAVSGIAVLYLFVPTPVTGRVHRETETVPAQLTQVLRDAGLLRLDLGIFVLHMVLMAIFVAVPLALKEQAGLSAEHHWKVYLGVLAGSVVCMAPFVIYTSRTRRVKGVFAVAIAAFALSLLGLGQAAGGLVAILLWMLLFFTAFNILEATLPSLVSRVAPAAMKGTALGVYSTSQFLGAFIGGSVGGILFQLHGATTVFAFCTAATGIWLAVVLTMPEPKFLSSRLLPVGRLTDEQANRLVAQLNLVAGVADAVVVAEDRMAYLKVDRDRLDEDALQALAVAEI